MQRQDPVTSENLHMAVVINSDMQIPIDNVVLTAKAVTAKYLDSWY